MNGRHAVQQDAQAPVEMEVGRWVAAARGGSQAAFASLYRRFLPLVHGILISRWPPADADELTQECFARAFERLHQLREEQHFGAWVASIARHARPTLREVSGNEASLERLADRGATPEQCSEAEVILRALGGLPEAYRETLALRLIEGLSGPEIAALTGLAAGSVRVNLHRGMARLREALGLAPAGHDEEAARA
ncbi:RNA polymerase sigma factor [Pseudomarimonas salicorniae]|uniref:Sigma-70 family RNA polymerase sigma factor n=1 Tax=Pseudomarimonas salicorniae TaxID=2933270 RepID=A0ABT0GJW5_9GAMM|nr:sigma-70 family RNA polymerase sigma factor [Lysobacter sp. CAU 1642]MCK7594844.1 sigma-70 family RNA polymerase sigma factor [Lysobacter sp. CAU 1642]